MRSAPAWPVRSLPEGVQAISLVLLRAALQSCNRNRRRRAAVVSSITGGWLRDLPNGWQGKLP